MCSSCLKQAVPLEAEFWCSRCRTPFASEEALGADGQCPLCAAEDESYDGAWCYGPYEGVLRRLIQVYKYEGVETLAEPLGRLLAESFPRDEEFDCIVPMPLHWLKRWKRGFNQADLLARVLARRTGVPLLDAMKRKRSTVVQAGLSLAGRRANVRGAFAVRKDPRTRARLKDCHVLLVDDVLTTGSTANACARVLKRAGARRVSILTVARADRKFTWTPEPKVLEHSAGGTSL